MCVLTAYVRSSRLPFLLPYHINFCLETGTCFVLCVFVFICKYLLFAFKILLSLQPFSFMFHLLLFFFFSNFTFQSFVHLLTLSGNGTANGADFSFYLSLEFYQHKFKMIFRNVQKIYFISNFFFFSFFNFCCCCSPFSFSFIMPCLFLSENTLVMPLLPVLYTTHSITRTYSHPVLITFLSHSLLAIILKYTINQIRCLVCVCVFFSLLRQSYFFSV